MSTRWRSRLRLIGDQRSGIGGKCGVAASASKPTDVHSLALAATADRGSGIGDRRKIRRSGERQQADGLRLVTGQYRKIGGGQVERGELVGEHPAECGMFQGSGRWARRGEAANEGKHFDGECGVVVPKRRKGADDFGLAAEFFVEFAEQRVGGRFTGLDLAAGKFPLEGEMFVGRSLGDEDAARGVLDDGAGDGEGFGWNHGRTKTRRAGKLHVISRRTVDLTCSASLR